MLSEDLKWKMNTTATVKKAQQRLYFLQTLKRNNLSPELLKSFYHCCIESVITYCVNAWYVNCPDKYRKSLSRVMRSAEKIIGLPLPPPWHASPFRTRCLRRAGGILKDKARKPSLLPAALWQTQPGHHSPHLQTAEQSHPQGHHRTTYPHTPPTPHPAQLFMFLIYSCVSACKHRGWTVYVDESIVFFVVAQANFVEYLMHNDK